MNAKRSNNAIWKLTVPEDGAPEDRVQELLESYAEQALADGGDGRPLAPIPLKQRIAGLTLQLYVRRSFSTGLLSFVEGYLMEADDSKKFHIRGVDACLFIYNETSLFAITSGGGYHVITDFVDYTFPFNTAKKLISNNFRAAEVRDMIGSRTSRAETYRRAYSISRSEAVDTVWKKLVGRLDAERLSETSPLRGLIDPDKPPAVEIKSSFVLRQKLDLEQVGRLIAALEHLDEPSPEDLQELSFLDNLYPVRNNPELTDALTRTFVENIRQRILSGSLPDIDLLDPDDIISFNAGSNFKLSYRKVSDSVPDLDDIMPAIRTKLDSSLGSEEDFFAGFMKLRLIYQINPDDASRKIRRRLVDFLHGQVEYDKKVYFRISKVWYHGLGDFLENLKRDFINEVFEAEEPVILRGVIPFLPWESGSEGAYNEAQAKQPNFYFGDEVFSWTDRGKVELFDLLYVDEANKKLYVIHAKKDFAAKMRDACSQILVAADILSRDIDNQKKVLSKYYEEQWSKHELNTSVQKNRFLSWFNYKMTYVVLCSTPNDFVPADFTEGRLNSHIARREIMSAKNEMKYNSHNFHLAHTRFGQ